MDSIKTLREARQKTWGHIPVNGYNVFEGVVHVFNNQKDYAQNITDTKNKMLDTQVLGEGTNAYVKCFKGSFGMIADFGKLSSDEARQKYLAWVDDTEHAKQFKVLYLNKPQTISEVDKSILTTDYEPFTHMDLFTPVIHKVNRVDLSDIKKDGQDVNIDDLDGKYVLLDYAEAHLIATRVGDITTALDGPQLAEGKTTLLYVADQAPGIKPQFKLSQKQQIDNGYDDSQKTLMKFLSKYGGSETDINENSLGDENIYPEYEKLMITNDGRFITGIGNRESTTFLHNLDTGLLTFYHDEVRGILKDVKEPEEGIFEVTLTDAAPAKNQAPDAKFKTGSLKPHIYAQGAHDLSTPVKIRFYSTKYISTHELPKMDSESMKIFEGTTDSAPAFNMVTVVNDDATESFIGIMPVPYPV